SVALKLVVDREHEIEKFAPEEYWHVFARLAGRQPPEFEAKLLKKSGNAIKIVNEEQSRAILADLERAAWTVTSVVTKERKRNAAPPFITSKLQQTARFPVKKTMMIAQQPYLTPDQYSLYKLIWNRFVASQMNPATFDETTVEVRAGDYTFRVKGTVPKFPGWMATYGLTPGEPEEKEKPDEDDDAVSGVLPPLSEGDRLELKALRPEQKF